MSSRGAVSGFLVNHFGGRWSAASPTCRRPSISSSTRMNRCGTAVSVVMPYRNGIRVRMLNRWRSVLRTRSFTGAPGLAMREQADRSKVRSASTRGE